MVLPITLELLLITYAITKHMRILLLMRSIKHLNKVTCLHILTAQPLIKRVFSLYL